MRVESEERIAGLEKENVLKNNNLHNNFMLFLLYQNKRNKGLPSFHYS